MPSGKPSTSRVTAKTVDESRTSGNMTRGTLNSSQSRSSQPASEILYNCVRAAFELSVA